MTRRPLSRRGGRRGGGGFRDDGSPSEVVGKEKSGMEEDISPLKSSSKESSPPPSSPPSLSSQSSQDEISENKTSKKEKYNTIVFFDFKEDKDGVLHFGAVKATRTSLIPFNEFYFRCKATGGGTFKSRCWIVYNMLNGRVVIGHDIKSKLQKLKEEFHHIKKKAPKLKKTIDTLPFIRSKTPLAKLAIKHGLGKETYYGVKACLMNLSAIAKCSTTMSSTEIDVHGVNPMIPLIEKCGTQESGQVVEESGTKESGTNESEEEDFNFISGLGMYFGGSSPQYVYKTNSPPSSQDEDPMEDSPEVETEKIQSAGQPARRSQRLMDKEAMKDKDKSAGGR